MADPDDQAFEDILHRVARTPDVFAMRRVVGPGSRLAGRFDVECSLGEGGMGRVFAAHDSERQARVALKMLGVLTPRSIVNIKREFRAAAELVHPNLVRLHELFCDGVEWFFTMDVVYGTTLPILRRRAGELSPNLLQSVFTQLALGLRALHDAGTLHGDLKPSNFLVTQDEQRVLLLDFGLARPLDTPCKTHLGAGTPEYIAPEQAGGARLTEAADWYSYGVVLYEAVTGRLPTPMDTAADLPTMAMPFRQLCLDLLQREPSKRPRGQEVLARIGSAGGQKRISSMPAVSRPHLLGRNSELAQLRAAFQASVDGEGAVVLVQGPSGIGKTALVEHFVKEAKDLGAFVLAGRCRERESVGYKAIDGLIDGIVEWLEALPQHEAKQLLPSDIADLTRLFPALRTAAAIAHGTRRDGETADQATVKRQAVAAFGDFLAHLRSCGPLVVWTDDLQWSDAESALLLARPLAGPNPVPLLFIGSYRTCSAQRGPMLDALFARGESKLPIPRELVLEPLQFGDAERLARQLLPKDKPGADALAHNIARDAGGHPLFVAELAFYAGVSNRSPDEQVPATLAELVAARVTSLPAQARGMLEAIALAGTPLARVVVRRAQSLSPAETEGALDMLRAQRLARTEGRGEKDAVDVHHDRIRELIAQGICAVDRERHHLALARALEAEPDSKPDILASHFQAGGALDKAGDYWILAADQAFHSLAFAHAAELYELGASLVHLDFPELRALQARRAEALAYAGKGALAAEAYLKVAETCTRDEALEFRRRAAEQLLLSGHLEKGLDVIEQVLRSLGMRKTRGGAPAFRSFLMGRLRLRARGLRYTPRPETSLSREELARIDASWTIACSLGVIDFVRGADFQNDHLLLALNAGEPRRLLRALTLEIAYATASGQSKNRTDLLLTLADHLAKETNDSAASGLLRVGRGVAAWLQGRMEPALVECEEAVQILKKCSSGTVWETATAQRFVIGSLFYLGRLAKLVQLVPALLQEAESQGNLYATTFFRTHFSNTAWLVQDRVEEARAHVKRARDEWTAQGFQVPHSWLLVGEAHLGFYTGEFESVLARIREQWPKLESAQVLRIRALRVQLWQVRAAAAAGVAAERRLNEEGSENLRELRREARHAARQVRRQPIAMAAPLAALLDAALDQAEGKIGEARGRLLRAVEQFDAQGMRLHAAAARARLAELTDTPDGELIRTAYALFESEGVVDPKRMVRMLSPGFVDPMQRTSVDVSRQKAENQ